jgi:hypothetical protein
MALHYVIPLMSGIFTTKNISNRCPKQCSILKYRA